LKSRTQGNQANQTGNQLEGVISYTFKNKGFEVLMYRQWSKNPGVHSSDLLLKNVPYNTIYGHKGNTEFLLKSERLDLEIRIECKWQQVAGSVDEKFPYLYLNCIETMSENKIFLIVDGDGYKAGALKWLKAAIQERRYQDQASLKDIRVFSLIEFITWANKNC
jgi:hypothetical protein